MVTETSFLFCTYVCILEPSLNSSLILLHSERCSVKPRVAFVKFTDQASASATYRLHARYAMLHAMLYLHRLHQLHAALVERV